MWNGIAFSITSWTADCQNTPHWHPATNMEIPNPDLLDRSQCTEMPCHSMWKWQAFEHRRVRDIDPWVETQDIIFSTTGSGKSDMNGNLITPSTREVEHRLPFAMDPIEEACGEPDVPQVLVQETVWTAFRDDDLAVSKVCLA